MYKMICISTSNRGLQTIAKAAIASMIPFSYNGGRTIALTIVEGETLPEKLVKTMKEVQRKAIDNKIVYEETQFSGRD